MRSREILRHTAPKPAPTEAARPLPTSWVMRTGERVKIADMTDDHLTNTILMIRRNCARMLENKADTVFMRELASIGCASVANGEGAQDACHEAILNARRPRYSVERYLAESRIYCALVAEGEHRSALREFEAHNTQPPTQDPPQ